MTISTNTISELNSKINIVDLITKIVPLKKKGANYLACCPFHQEKTSSFFVNPAKQIFHCFGCGISGDAIAFVMKYHNYDFITALKSLAEDYGVNIPQSIDYYHSQGQTILLKQEKQDLKQTIAQVATFFKQNLTTYQVVKDYLNQRGLNNEVIQLFNLGYAPNDYQALKQIFKDYATNINLINCGAIAVNENSQIYDRFRQRLIFPITNIQGEIIAFGGRVIAGGEPKYLNSPETILFNKSQELYGLYQAKNSISINNQVVVVEGYLDVIALHQFGFKQVVATMGTALSEDQLKILFRLSDNIIFCFDGDKAGKKAALRALELAINYISDNKFVSFLFLNEMDDPDTYIRREGLIQFIDLIEHHQLSLFSFLVNHYIIGKNFKSYEAKAHLISQLQPYIIKIKSNILQTLLKKQLAEMVDLDLYILENLIYNRKPIFYPSSKKNDLEKKITAIKILSQPTVIQRIAKIIITNPAIIKNFPSYQFDHLLLPNQDHRSLITLIIFLQLHCDDYQDIKITQLAKFQFSEIKLINIIQEINHEIKIYNQLAVVTEEEFYSLFNKLKI